MEARRKGKHRVVGGVVCRGGRALVVHRSPMREWYPNVWDLPVGHVEPGEAPSEALRSELLEELGVLATIVGEAFMHLEDVDYEMAVWVVDHFVGEPVKLDPEEHDAIAWMDQDELDGLPVAHPQLEPT